MNELEITKTAILPLHEDSHIDQMRDARLFLNRLKEIVAELEGQWRSAALANCEKNGDFMVLDVRYYAGKQKVTKCRDVRQAVEAVFLSCGGDFDAFVDCLASDALKPGATRKIMPPELFDRHFEEIDKTALKHGDPLKRQLFEVNSRFLR